MQTWNHRQGALTSVMVLLALVVLAPALTKGQADWLRYPGAVGGLMVLLLVAYLVAASPGHDAHNLLFANVALLLALFLLAVSAYPVLGAWLGIAVYPIIVATLGTAASAWLQSGNMLRQDRLSVQLVSGGAIAVLGVAIGLWAVAW